MPVAQQHIAGSSGDFSEGVIVSRNIDGQDVIFIRRQGRVHCYLDQCTHQPVKLSEFGEVMGARLVCHAHGGTFDLDRDGAVVCDPPLDALKSFMTQESQGQVLVFI
jgi:nitrite reductase/ring-hydroxylating ferredoxin subunit